MSTISGNPFEMAKDAADTVIGGVGNANSIIGTTEDLKSAIEKQDSAAILRLTADLVQNANSIASVLGKNDKGSDSAALFASAYILEKDVRSLKYA